MKELTNKQLAEVYDFGTIKAFKYVWDFKNQTFIKTTRDYCLKQIHI